MIYFIPSLINIDKAAEAGRGKLLLTSQIFVDPYYTQASRSEINSGRIKDCPVGTEKRVVASGSLAQFCVSASSSVRN